MKKKCRFSEVFFAAVYFFSNVIALHAGETNFWRERRAQTKRYSSPALLCQLPPVGTIGFSPSIDSVSGASSQTKGICSDISRADLTSVRTANSRDGSVDWLQSLVSPFGTVRDIHVSPHSDRPLMIHIQDIHGNVGAQKNIAQMIEALSTARGVSLVGLEGATGPFDLDDLRRFPDMDAKEDATNWAIKKDLIGGAEKIGITSEKPLTLWGIEDKSLYEANVEAVKGSLARKAEALSFLREFNSVLDRLKKATYSVELAAYDANVRAYQEGHLGLAKYLAKLIELDSKKTELRTRSPNIAVLLEAFDLESKMDFKEVERQRADVVDHLARRLDDSALKELVNQSLGYRAGRMTYSRYYAYVKELCKTAKVDVARFPALMDYIAYVGLTDRIHRDRLLTELSDLDETVASQLARTDREKDTLALSRDSLLLGNLTNNTMTPEIWARYQNRRVFVKNLVSRASVLATGLGVDISLAPPERFDGFLTPFEDFCRLAMERNTALTDRLWKKMEETKSKSAILVAGGFHTEGLTELIKTRGGSYIVLTPRVETIDTKNNYLDAFAHDPLPLEKLFDGEKIGILTLRGLSREGQQERDVLVPQALAVRMILNIVQRAYRRMKSDGATLEVIKRNLTENIKKLRSIGNLFENLLPRLTAVTNQGSILNFSMKGIAYSARTNENGGYSLTPLDRPGYDHFQRSRFGKFLKANALFLFKAMTAIFNAPFDEASLTTNKALKKFIDIHHWRGIDVFIGFQLVRLMTLMTFVPALYLFYLAVTGDVHAVVKMGIASVGLIAFFRNNKFYIPSHMATNVFGFAINLLLEAVDFIAKLFGSKVEYRVPYLSGDGSENDWEEYIYDRNVYYQPPPFLYQHPLEVNLTATRDGVSRNQSFFIYKRKNQMILRIGDQEYSDEMNPLCFDSGDFVHLGIRNDLAVLWVDLKMDVISFHCILLNNDSIVLNKRKAQLPTEVSEGEINPVGDIKLYNFIRYKNDQPPPFHYTGPIQLTVLADNLTGSFWIYKKRDEFYVLLGVKEIILRKRVALELTVNGKLRDLPYRDDNATLIVNKDGDNLRFEFYSTRFHEINLKIERDAVPDGKRWQFNVRANRINAVRNLFLAMKGKGNLTDVDWSQVLNGVKFLRRARRGNSLLLTSLWEMDFSHSPNFPEPPSEENISWLLGLDKSDLKKLGDQLKLMVLLQKALEYQEAVTKRVSLGQGEFFDLSQNYKDFWELIGTTTSPDAATPNPQPDPRTHLEQAMERFPLDFDIDIFMANGRFLLDRIENERAKYSGLDPDVGSWGLWNFFGFNNLPWNGFWESVLVGGGVVLGLNVIFPSIVFTTVDWISLFSPDTVTLAIAVYLTVFVFNYFMHLLTGVQKAGGKPSVTILSDGWMVMAKAAWAATVTASQGQVVGAGAIVAGFLLQSPWIAVIGILWWAARHAYRNYTTELPYRHARNISEGVKVVSYSANLEGRRTDQDPRASTTDFLRTIFFGSPAGPRLTPVERTVYAFQTKSMDAALAAKGLFGTTNDSLLRTDPTGWIGQEGLSYLDRNKTGSEMSQHIAFLNLVVQVYSKIGESMSPAIFEMPSPAQFREDPAASRSVAAALIAYGAGNRPLTLVAKDMESTEAGWQSQDAMQEAAREALSRYAPHRVGEIGRKFKEGQISSTLATNSLINPQGQYLLARIIVQAFGSDALKYQPYVLGKKSNFDPQGTENPIFFDLLLYSKEFLKNIQKQALFLIAA